MTKREESVGPLRQGVRWLRDLFLPSSGLMIGENRLFSKRDVSGNQDPYWKRRDGTEMNLTGELRFVRCTSNLTLTTSWQSIVATGGDSSKLRILLPTIGEWLVTATADLARGVNDPGVMTVGLFVADSGTEEDGNATYDASTSGERVVASQQWKIITTSANTAIELKAIMAGAGGNATLRSEHTTLSATIGAGGGSTVESVDHGTLIGRGDDDHTQYGQLADAETVPGLWDFTGGIKADVIAESTGATGVTIDGAELKDGGVNIAASQSYAVAGTAILSDSAGTMTLSNVDALDATTESAVEAAIDTLANLTSIQGRTVTLADAGANAIFGWDDTANAYENLSKAEALAVLNVADGADVTGANAPKAHGPSSHTEGTGWRMVYQDTNGDDTEIGFSDDGKVLTSAGAAAAPTFEAADGHSHTSQSGITTVGTIGTGTWEATDVGVAHGGTGQSTAQAAINALTTVSGATDEHVLTKDTATGNAIFKAAAGGGGDLATDTLWAAAGDLVKGTGDDAADILSIGAANSILVCNGTVPSWAVNPRCDRLGIGCAAGAVSELTISPALSVGFTKYIVNLNPVLTTTASNKTYEAIRGSMTIWPNDGVDGTDIYALDFIVKTWTTGTVTVDKLIGIRALTIANGINAAAAVTVTDSYGIKLESQIGLVGAAGGAVTVVNQYGIHVGAPATTGGAPTITNNYGLVIENTAHGTAKNYLVEVGGTIGTTPYFRVMGNFTAQALRTPVYVSEGATPTLRQLRTMDPGAGGTNFSGAELVCILV